MRIPLPTVLAALASAALHVAAGMCASTIQFAGSPGVPIRVTLLPARPLAVGDGTESPRMAVEQPRSTRDVEPPPRVAQSDRASTRPHPPAHAQHRLTARPRIADEETTRVGESVVCAREETAGNEAGAAASGNDDGRGAIAGSGRGSSGGEGGVGAEVRYGINPKPPYPLAARHAGEQGTVTLHVLVRSDGTVGAVQVVESSGYTVLDDSAVQTVRDRWRFAPARLNGVAIESWVKVPIRFTLDRA